MTKKTKDNEAKAGKPAEKLSEDELKDVTGGLSLSITESTSNRLQKVKGSEQFITYIDPGKDFNTADGSAIKGADLLKR